MIDQQGAKGSAALRRRARRLTRRLARRAFHALPARRRSRLLAELSAQPGVLQRLLDGIGDDPDLQRQVIEAVATRIDFETWERNGWHLTRNEFYSVIPDTASLPDTLWKQPSELVGVDMRDEAQVAFLAEAAERWGDEFNRLPLERQDDGGYYVNNLAFESVDAEIYWSLIRASKPRTVIEIGSGWSTLLADQALAANQADGHEGRLTAIEPYPLDFLRDLARRSPRVELEAVPLQSLPVESFERLGEGDILFIDSSHVCKIGSDVQYEILELLPRLRPGVLVHLHDIFLPGEYPRDWVLGPEHRFWNEQYLLHAFLAFNRAFEVVWGSAWMHANHPDLLERAIASYDRSSRLPGSFWLRRVGG